MSLRIHHECVIPKEYALQRLDQAVAALLPQYSRARLQQWIKDGELTLNGKSVKPRDKVFGGEVIRGFTAGLIWGVLIGTYSSIALAVPMLLYMNLRASSLELDPKDDEAKGEAGDKPGDGATGDAKA